MMDRTQKRKYLLTLAEELKNYGIHPIVLKNIFRIKIKKHKGQMEYITCQFSNNGELYFIREVCSINFGRTYSPTDANVKIDFPHCENLVRIAELYFEHGKGANPSNPKLEQLINTRSNRIKSARTI